MRAGGDFYYDPPDAANGQDLLLLAGGVGINPLFSMLQHFLHINPGQSSPSGDNSCRKAALLYSAQSPEELIFKVGEFNIKQIGLDQLLFKVCDFKIKYCSA